jgi:peroxiredoxin
MARSDNVYELPADLPVPVDDGACVHLTGMRVPRVPLAATDGAVVELAALASTTVVYCYPRTGRPDVDPPDGWNQIPGARVFGFSTQATDYQREAAERLHLPFALLSDADLRFVPALRLPTFAVAGMTLVKRLTLIVDDGTISKVFYPVFPPDTHADEVLAWLKARPRPR